MKGHWKNKLKPRALAPIWVITVSEVTQSKLLATAWCETKLGGLAPRSVEGRTGRCAGVVFAALDAHYDDISFVLSSRSPRDIDVVTQVVARTYIAKRVRC